MPAIRPATATAKMPDAGAAASEEEDEEQEEAPRSHSWNVPAIVGDDGEDNDVTSLHKTDSRPRTGVNFYKIEGSQDGGGDNERSIGGWDLPPGVGGGLPPGVGGGEYEGQSGLDDSGPKPFRGRTPLGYLPHAQRPFTQGGPNGFFPSAVPQHARVKSALTRERAVLKTPGVKVFHMQDTTYHFNVETGVSKLALSRLSRTAHGDEPGFRRQKKLVSVPYIRKKRPVTTGEDESQKEVVPEHLRVRWRLLTSMDERRNFEKDYSTRYKQKNVLSWKWEDTFSFVADSFINDTQVDVAGLPLPKKLINEDGIRSDACLDVLVMRQVKIERMDGKKFMAKVKRNLLAKVLKLESTDPSLADVISTAANDFMRLNSRKQVEKLEGITALQTFEEAYAENADEVLMQELMVREIELRRERARLNELREKLAPLQAKFAQGLDEYQSLEQHYDRLKTPDVRAFVRPKSRRAVLSLKKAVDQDLSLYQDKWLAMTKQEQELARAVRKEEMATLALRQQVETAQLLRESRRRRILEDQLKQATELEDQRDSMMKDADKLMQECDERIRNVADIVQTQFDRGERNKLLRSIGDKLFLAKKMCIEACRIQYREKRIEGLEASLEFAIEKLRDGDMHLTKLQACLVSGAAVEDSDPHGLTALMVFYKDSIEHMRKAKRDYKRTGALDIAELNIKEFHDSIDALQARIGSLQEAKRQEQIEVALAAAAASATSKPEVVEYESSSEEEEYSEFEKTLERLIEDKKRQALERVTDSLCSMQQWLFEVKSKSKGQKAASSAGGSSRGAASRTSTRPASPWTSHHSLPPVDVPAAISPPRGKTAAPNSTQQSLHGTSPARGESPPKTRGSLRFAQ